MLIIVILFMAGCTAKPEAKESTNQESPVPNAVDKVVTINKKDFYQTDLTLYGLMEKIKIEWNRAADQAKLTGTALADKEKYWDEQIAYYDNENVLLQQLIEINAMALLGEEKNYFIPDEKLEQAMKKLEQDIANNQAAMKLVEEYRERDVKKGMQAYVQRSLLRDRVAKDLEKQLIADHPEASEAEINYELNQSYEALYQDQLGSLDITIYRK